MDRHTAYLQQKKVLDDKTRGLEVKEGECTERKKLYLEREQNWTERSEKT